MSVARAARQCLPALALAGSAFLSACGSAGQNAGTGRPPSEPPGAAAVRSASEDYFDAIRAGDGEAICRRMTPALRRSIVRLQGAACEATMGEEARRLPEPLAGYRIERVSLAGARATLTLVPSGRGSREGMTLVRRQGGWKVARAPGLGR